MLIITYTAHNNQLLPKHDDYFILCYTIGDGGGRKCRKGGNNNNKKK